MPKRRWVVLIIREQSFWDNNIKLTTEIEHRIKINSVIRVAATNNQISAIFKISKLTQISNKHKKCLLLCTVVVTYNNSPAQAIVYVKQFRSVDGIVKIILEFLHTKTPKQVQNIFRDFKMQN